MQMLFHRGKLSFIVAILMMMVFGGVATTLGEHVREIKKETPQYKTALRPQVNNPFRDTKQNSETEIKATSYFSQLPTGLYFKVIQGAFLVSGIFVEAKDFEWKTPAVHGQQRYRLTLFRSIISPNAP